MSPFENTNTLRIKAFQFLPPAKEWFQWRPACANASGRVGIRPKSDILSIILSVLGMPPEFVRESEGTNDRRLVPDGSVEELEERRSDVGKDARRIGRI